MTSRTTWAHRAAHPEWWPRLLTSGIRTGVLWRRQGRPTDFPVVIGEGMLIAGPDGTSRGGMIHGFAFDFSRVEPGTRVDLGGLWRRLTQTYPVHVHGTEPPGPRPPIRTRGPVERRVRQAGGWATVLLLVAAAARVRTLGRPAP